MLMVVSPAKSLDYEPLELSIASRPRFKEKTTELTGILKTKSAAELSDLMHISENLAVENARRYQRFGKRLKKEEKKQALFAFNGHVYQGMQVEDFSEEDLEFTQKHLRILSGLYGLLRPMDKIQAYRLEMGTKLANAHGKNLYEFWNSDITKLLNKDLKAQGDQVLINLASQEYFKAIKSKEVKGTIIHIHFKELRGDKYKIISFNAKVARGQMARFIIKNRLSQAEQIKSFQENNYLFNPNLSDEQNWVFTR